jgi:hypothetical protein
MQFFVSEKCPSCAVKIDSIFLSSVSIQVMEMILIKLNKAPVYHGPRHVLFR